MTSTANRALAPEPYIYQRPSVSSTRSIIESNNPSTNHSTTSPPTTTSSSAEADINPDDPHYPIPSDAITPEYHSPKTHFPHSHAFHRTSANYEKALLERAAATSTTPLHHEGVGEAGAKGVAGSAATNEGELEKAKPKFVAGLAYRGEGIDVSEERPGIGLLGRQQSWSASEKKRGEMEKMLGAGKQGGYTSSGGQ